MKSNNILILVCFVFIIGCEQYKPNKYREVDLKPEKKYSNTGFALIYKQDLDIKKLDNRSLQIYHKSLKKRSLIKITNPLNNKSLIAEVSSNKVKFSNFYIQLSLTE